MRAKLFVRCSVSCAALALSTAPLFAQDSASSAQPRPAPGSAPAADEPVDIVVTGLRQSLESQQGIRRNSDQIVDAIVAEDIAALPDVTVSDTAARIPGIQVERAGGEANRVLVRGLDREFYTTTYNGREIFTAETRSVALQDFPAGAIAAVEAFKTSSANLVEPGLAGLINVRSRRPFDFSGFEIAGSVWGVHTTQARDVSPNANLLITDRWETGIGEIGALVNLSYTQLRYRDSIRRHGFFIADLAGGRAPDWPETRYNEGNRWRPSINGTLQWRPNPDLEFYIDGLWQGYREEVSDRMWAQPLWGGVHSNLVFRDGTNFIESGTVTNPGAPGETWGFQGGTFRHTDTYQFAIGGRWDAGPLRVTADLARTDSTFTLETESVDYEINTNNYIVDYVIGSPDGPGPTFRTRGLDPTDPSIYNFRGFYEDYLTARGDDWQGRLDFTYEPGLAFLPEIQFGVRYVDRNASADRGDFYWNLTARGCCGGPNAPTPFSAVPLDYRLFAAGFRGDRNKPFPYTWLAPTYDSIRTNVAELRQYLITRTGVGSVDGPPINPSRSYDINERSIAGYVQGRFAFDIGTVGVEAIAGIRGVRTTSEIQGTLSAPGAAPAPISLENETTDWLPSLSIRARLTPRLQLRLAATRTRTRPTFEQLNPALVLDPPPGCQIGQSGCARGASGGNPFLEPLESDNYDASLEYYFSRAGFVSVTAFRRDMRGFIANRSFEFPEPDAETGLPLIVRGPVNTRSGRIQGFEAQISTFFDFDGLPDWTRPFGIQANVTHLDATANYDLFSGANATTQRLPLPDVSKWSYNLVGIYEQDGFSLRLAYNWRSSFAEGAINERDNFYTLQGRGRPVSRLDLSTNYAFNDNLTIFFDWINILGDPFQSDIVRTNYANGAPASSEVFPLVYRFEETVFSGGIRFRF